LIEKIHSINNDKEITTLWEKIQEKGFISYKINPNNFDINQASFKELSLEDKKRFLIEVLDKNQLYVNFSEINDTDFNLSKEVKQFNSQFHK